MSKPAQTPLATASAEPPIVLQDVTRTFGETAVLRGINLTIPRGQSTVIMGESGSGKSVLIKHMNGLLLPDSGSVRLFGRDTREVSRRELMQLRRRIGTLFQNYALLDSMTVEENVAFPLVEGGDTTPRQARERTMKLLETLRIADAANLRPAELSGGMRKRVSLARALVTDPEVVLFDEPTTGLDPVMIELVDDMIIEAKETFGITSVIISHDMASAFRLANRMAMLHRGQIVFSGTPDETRGTDNAVVRSFVGSRATRIERSEAAPASAETTGISWDSLPAPPCEPMVEVRELTRAFGDRKVLEGVSLYVLPQQITTIIGGSGSGKTVLMKHILGLLRPDSGSINVFGRNLAELEGRELLEVRRRFGMLFQGAALFDSMTILENTAFPLVEAPRTRVGRGEAKERALETLRKLRIVDLADKLPSDVSSGQRKRAGLARAIVAQPEIIVYDEPTTGLDPVMTAYVNDMIVEAQQAFNITAIVISHDMASTFRISHRIAMLYRGRIIAFGSPDDIRASTHPRVREFVFAGAV